MWVSVVANSAHCDGLLGGTDSQSSSQRSLAHQKIAGNQLVATNSHRDFSRYLVREHHCCCSRNHSRFDSGGNFSANSWKKS